ncbi:MAG: hypothetical protein WKF78_04835 [Candidatus Limnocylindrales bacterium]
MIDAFDRRRIDDQDRDVQVAQLGDGVGRRPAIAAGNDQVGVKRDDLLDVDGEAGCPERGHARQARGVGRVVAALVGRDDASAGAKLEQDLGVRRGERHDVLGLGVEGEGSAVVIGHGDREGRGLGRAHAGAGARGDDGHGAGGQGRRDGSRGVGRGRDGGTGWGGAAGQDKSSGQAKSDHCPSAGAG